MKRTLLRLAALAVALCLALSLAACGGSEDDEEEEPGLPQAALGGEDVPYPEGFDTTAKYNAAMNGSTLCIAFNGIMTRTTDYFVPSGDTITLTAAATTESTGIRTFKAALWQKVEGGSVYVEGATLVFGANGELYTGTFAGLDPNEEYKVTISYDSGYYTITGGMSIDGLATAEELAARAEAAAA